jgi:hypothetical protein
MPALEGPGLRNFHFQASPYPTKRHKRFAAHPPEVARASLPTDHLKKRLAELTAQHVAVRELLAQ